MNTEDSEFERIEREAKRRAQAAEDDDTQSYTSEAYRCGFEAGAVAERENVKPPVNQFNRGIEACMSRLYEMHRTTTGRHNFYVHAALELAKLKEGT